MPEFNCIVPVVDGAPVPAGAKLLRPALKGGKVQDAVNLSMVRDNDVGTKLGYWHTPKEFMDQAMQCGHPSIQRMAVDDVSKEVLYTVLTSDPKVVSLKRRLFIKQVEVLAKRLEPAEKALRDGLPLYMQKTLKGKRILLFEQLLT